MKVSSKQDGSRVRTAEDLERKYDLQAIVGLKKAAENSENGLMQTNAVLEDFMVATLGSIENLQSQIDGNISTWFYSGPPTMDNMPAKEWSTDDEKTAHLGDLYYDQDTGYAYRFSQSEGIYAWLKITDNDVVEALALANTAQDTADGKRRVFTDTPSPPYDKGDLWFKDKEIYICCFEKKAGERFETFDFGIATIYTDDTKAKEVESDLKENYLTTVETKAEISKSAEELSAVVSKVETEMNGRVTLTETQYKQLVNMFSWIVESGTGETSFILTDKMAELIAEVISLNGNVKVKGEMLVDGSVSAKKINVEDLFAQDIAASGIIRIGGKKKGAVYILDDNDEMLGYFDETGIHASRFYGTGENSEQFVFNGWVGGRAGDADILVVYGSTPDAVEYSTHIGSPLGKIIFDDPIYVGNLNIRGEVIGPLASSTAEGLMSRIDKVKLDGIDAEANKTTFSNVYSYEASGGNAIAFSQSGASAMYNSLKKSMDNNFDNDGDVLIPYVNVTTLNQDIIAVAPTITDWTKYKGYVIGIASNNGVEWQQTKYVPRSLAQSVAPMGLNTIRMQVYDSYIYEGTCVFDVANHKATFKSYRLTGWTEARAFIYGIK